MKYPFLLLLIFALSGCSTAPDADDTYTVGYHGALKNMMHKGDISAQANLADFRDEAHLYALGAVENLKGEILILDGEPYITSAEGQNLTLDHSFDHKATLLVYASVNEWTSHSIPKEVSTYEDLESHIEKVAKENGINTDEPFPFLINGMAETADWHVINWKDGDTEHSHEKHIKSGAYGTLSNQEVEILGFYSRSHHAIFTHHTTNMHLHVRATDNSTLGHLDGLALSPGMTLKLPTVK
ncbi:acetolactate decarboxylase [Cryomorphaceae bacterium 1068]|nr:acetolactate decarboxylase [Cryomorphaceae bacterium 1068]